MLTTPWDILVSPVSGPLSTKGVEGDSSGAWYWVRCSDGRYGIAFRLSSRVEGLDKMLRTTAMIDIIKVPDINSQNYLCVLIKSSELATVFQNLCNDLMNTCSGITEPQSVLQLISQRVKSWQRLFKREGSKLNPKEIVGLMAEMKFLFSHWINISSSKVDGWLGPLDNPQDFTDESIGVSVEVKSYAIDKGSVSISSIEQLDCDDMLYLVAYSGESSTDNNAYGLNEYVEFCRSKIDSSWQSLFDGRLLDAGYQYDPYYDEHTFVIGEPKIYTVNESFPCLRQSELGAAILKARYEMNLADLVEFRINVEEFEAEVKSG